MCQDDSKVNFLLDKAPKSLRKLIVMKDVDSKTVQRAKNRGIELFKFDDVEELGANKNHPEVVGTILNYDLRLAIFEAYRLFITDINFKLTWSGYLCKDHHREHVTSLFRIIFHAYSIQICILLEISFKLILFQLIEVTLFFSFSLSFFLFLNCLVFAKTLIPTSPAYNTEPSITSKLFQVLPVLKRIFFSESLSKAGENLGNFS